jgi:lysophospholipase L1-like esterase
VFVDDKGKPGLDVARYIKEACDGMPPDVVVFKLGINDCFGANPDTIKATDERIDLMFAQADLLIAAFRQAAPPAKLGICLTTPPNSRQKAFEANYKDRYPRWGWKRIQHRLVERQLERFATHADKQLFVIPTQLYLDPIDGYPANNGVHPNAMGYVQIGRAGHSRVVIWTPD